jgi:Sugar (and other) transporter
MAAFSAILFIIHPESVYFVFPARILAGLSHGIAYLTVLVHACEVSVPRLRGTIVATVHLCLFVGVFTTSSCLLPVYETRSYDVDPTKSVGINGLICIMSGLIIAIFFNRESPVFLIKKHKEKEAINIMIRLRSESHETSEIRCDFNELKLMVAEDNKSNSNIFSRKNLWPLSLVLFMKIVFVASFNMPLNLVWLEATSSKFYNGYADASGMCLSAARWVTIIASMFFIDVKRVKLYRLSAGIAMFILLALFFVIKSSEGLDDTTVITVLAFGFQMSSGLAFGVISDIYSTEAFNTMKKPLSIAFTSSMEFALQVFMIITVYYMKLSPSSVAGSAAFVMGLASLAFFIPDTSKMSLRMARNKFNS